MKLFSLSLPALFLLVSGCPKKEVPEGSPIAVEGYTEADGAHIVLSITIDNTANLPYN
jgi:hypothetical protein